MLASRNHESISETIPERAMTDVIITAFLFNTFTISGCDIFVLIFYLLFNIINYKNNIPQTCQFEDALVSVFKTDD
jgi:hypothetical protein